jgi:hypothetical protein
VQDVSDGLTLMCGVQEGGGVRYGGDWLVLDKVGERLELNIGDCCDSLMLGRGRLVVVGKKLQLVMGGGGSSMMVKLFCICGGEIWLKDRAG